ncbi:acyl--CoA ligase [Arthrobacter rhombi]
MWGTNEITRSAETPYMDKGSNAMTRYEDPSETPGPVCGSGMARAEVDDYTPSWVNFHRLLDERSTSVEECLLWYDESRGEECRWNHREWAGDVVTSASLLAEAGVRQGSTVTMLAANRPETLLTAFAAWSLGACFMPLDPRDTPEHHQRISQDIDNLWIVHVGTGHTSLPGRAVKMPDYARLRRLQSSRSYVEATSLDVPALRMHTSGTSGPPKPILISMRALLTNSDAMHQAFGWTPRTRALTVLPISHANGLIISSFLPWYIGASSVLLDRFRRGSFWATAARLRATTCSLVPTILEYLLSDNGRVREMPCPLHLAEVFSGSGPLRAAAAEEFEDLFGIPVRQLYGLSETTAVLTTTPKRPAGGTPSDFRPSIGVPVPHGMVEVIDASGNPCAEGERGEIVARGAMLMDGYAKNAEATAEAFAEGWFHTGDRGYWVSDDAAERWFFLEGRLREVIRRSGSTILPQLIDDVVASHPAVERAGVIGFPNRWYGEEIAVFVVAQSAVTEEEILQWCADRLDFEHRPKVVLFGDDFPLTAVGKIRRGVLSRKLAAQLEPYWEATFRSTSPPKEDDPLTGNHERRKHE